MNARVLIAICVLLATSTALARRRRPTTTTIPPPFEIPRGYTYNPATRSAYRYYHGSFMTWHGAKSWCEGDGAHLVVMNDADEAEVVRNIMRESTGLTHLTWSGLTDKRTGGVMDWRSVLGEPVNEVYNVWDEGHPKDNPKWPCALYDPSTKRLTDAPCDYNYQFICEASQSQ